MRKEFALLLMILSMIFASACTARMDIPTGFPTPPGPEPAKPAPKMEFNRDPGLEKMFAKIAEDAKGKVGVAAVVLETGEAAFLNAEDRYPMQSVYKLPIAMAVMEEVRLGKFDLDEKVGVTPADFVRKGMASSLRDKNPNGGEFTIRELIRLSLVESDGTASDVLLRILGGASEVQSYLTQIGITDMKVVNTEKEIGRDWQTQYENWATPMASLELLRALDASVREGRGSYPVRYLDQGMPMVFKFMSESVPGQMRLKRLLPRGTTVAHKTGTGGTRNSLTSATNDVGLIDIGVVHVAIAVFVSDSPADEKTREAVIAKIAKAAWDRWEKK